MKENWVQDESPKRLKRKAIENKKKRDQLEKGRKFKFVPHPTLKKTVIQVEIK